MKTGFALLSIIVVAITIAMTTNVFWQHFYCEQAWSRCDALSIVPCAPVSVIEQQWRLYEQLARKEKP
nr:hypothetical protein [uncultured Desulfobulbus sp.]